MCVYQHGLAGPPSIAPLALRGAFFFSEVENINNLGNTAVQLTALIKEKRDIAQPKQIQKKHQNPDLIKNLVMLKGAFIKDFSWKQNTEKNKIN